jgi:hypothetical protein
MASISSSALISAGRNETGEMLSLGLRREVFTALLTEVFTAAFAAVFTVDVLPEGDESWNALGDMSRFGVSGFER